MEGLEVAVVIPRKGSMNKLLLNLINKKRLSVIDSLSSLLKNEICYYADYDDCAYHHQNGSHFYTPSS